MPRDMFLISVSCTRQLCADSNRIEHEPNWQDCLALGRLNSYRGKPGCDPTTCSFYAEKMRIRLVFFLTILIV